MVRTTGGWPKIDAHLVTVTRGYYASEVGSGYALEPWGGNTRDYEGYSMPVRLRVHPDATLAESNGGEQLFYLPGEPGGNTLQAMLDRHLAVPE